MRNLFRSHFGSNANRKVGYRKVGHAMPSSFSTARLEGRALEDTLAGDRSHRIRMKDDRTRVFRWVGGVEAAEIRKYMAARFSQVKEEMAQHGLTIQDGDCPVRIKGARRSVDARLWSSFHGANALVEAKWTRGLARDAMAEGEKSLPMLRDACSEGVWLRSRAKVKASVVGVLVVKPSSWRCVLSYTDGSSSAEYPTVSPPPPKKRRGGKSQSGAQKRKTNLKLKAADQLWRKLGRGRIMTRRHEKAYVQTPKGKKARARINKQHYESRRSL